jgi:hypothetical protein
MPTRQTVQKKPATVIRTEIVRVTMPAARRLGATEIATPELRTMSPIDLDAEPGRGRDPG